MIERFQGKDGREKLVSTLQRQMLTGGDFDTASYFAEIGTLETVAANTSLVVQNDISSDLFLILVGEISVRVNQREIAIRRAGQHVGEMAAIDPAARRSATLIALSCTTLLRVSEEHFSRWSNTHPELWRRLAIELGCRLRERSTHVRTPNPRPVVFVGSSRESLATAEAIEVGIRSEELVTRLWTRDQFEPGSTNIQSLARAVNESDFALLVFGPDDTVLSRGRKSRAPRDNVIFELGLFMGKLGQDRSIMVLPRTSEERRLSNWFGLRPLWDLKIPTDLHGVVPISFEFVDGDNLALALREACSAIRQLVRRKGPI